MAKLQSNSTKFSEKTRCKNIVSSDVNTTVICQKIQPFCFTNDCLRQDLNSRMICTLPCPTCKAEYVEQTDRFLRTPPCGTSQKKFSTPLNANVQDCYCGLTTLTLSSLKSVKKTFSEVEKNYSDKRKVHVLAKTQWE